MPMLIMAELSLIIHMVEPLTADVPYLATHEASALQKLMVDTDMATTLCLVIHSFQDLVPATTQEESSAAANVQLSLDGDTVTMPFPEIPIFHDPVLDITQEVFSAVNQEVCFSEKMRDEITTI